MSRGAIGRKADDDAANVGMESVLPDNEVQSVIGAEPDGRHHDGDSACRHLLRRLLERVGDVDDMTIPEQRIPQG